MRGGVGGRCCCGYIIVVGGYVSRGVSGQWCGCCCGSGGTSWFSVVAGQCCICSICTGGTSCYSLL